MKKNIILFVILWLSSAFGGESLFGVIPHSLGIRNIGYSGNGMARSYEVAVHDSLQINYLNSSLWTDISHPTYTVKLAYHAAFGDDGQKNNYFNDMANFEGAFLAIPILKKKFVFGAGLQPFTSVEQRIADSLNSDIKEELLLRGGLSKAMFNISYRPFSRLGLAVGYEYNFGKITNRYRLDYKDTNLSPLRFNYEYRFYGHGVVVSGFFQPFRNLTLGVVYRPKENVNIRVQGETSSSTLDRSELQKLTLPQQFNFGWSYLPAKRLRFGGDVVYEDWSDNYTVNEQNVGGGFSNYLRVGFGFERLQSSKIFTNFFEKLDYRAGFYYTRLSVKSNANPVTEYGLSLGTSVPIQRFKSHIDFYGIIGKRGRLPDNNYEEFFFKFGFTVSANELWFVQLED